VTGVVALLMAGGAPLQAHSLLSLLQTTSIDGASISACGAMAGLHKAANCASLGELKPASVAHGSRAPH
jgi:hypothetical protein